MSAKAMFAIAIMAAGTAAAGTVVYMQVNPRAFTSARPAPVASEPETSNVTLAPVKEETAIAESRLDEPVSIEPVLVSATPQRAKKARASKVKKLIPCSDWQGLATGPAGRQVRGLCEVEQ
jgi:hypothetical protein